MFSKLGFPILTTYCGANFVPWWLGSFWYFLIDLIPGSSLALDCYAMYVWHFSLWYFTEYHSSKKINLYVYTYSCQMLKHQDFRENALFYKCLAVTCPLLWDANQLTVPGNPLIKNDWFHLYFSWKIQINRCLREDWHGDSCFNDTCYLCREQWKVIKR